MREGKQYRNLIVAGSGAVGQALFAFNDPCLDAFEEITIIDRDPGQEPPGRLLPARARFLTADIQDEAWLGNCLAASKTPALFLNLCSGVDNLRIRRLVGHFDIAYLDACCCAPQGSNEVRFSRMMPYTLTKVASRRPQWLCWGINPGLVEFMTRKIMSTFEPGEDDFEVTIYEHDQLENGSDPVVGWCPDALIEEIMQSPTLEWLGGTLHEEADDGARHAVACWEGEEVPSRIVAHEDIWNIGLLPRIRQARFIYGLHPRVMRFLEGDIEEAKTHLKVPEPTTPVYGLERIAVSVRGRASGRERVMMWEEDHHDTWRRLGINAVQYQTGKALLLALRLLCLTRYGELNGTYCAADLPVTGEDRHAIDSLMEDLAIHWRDASHLELRLCG